MKSKLFAALLLAGTATVADATVYTSTRTVGTATATLSITTDGKIGVLAAANIVDFTITMINGDVTTTLFGPGSADENAHVSIAGPAFTATATQLLFNFDVPGNNYALFQGSLDIGRPSYCLQTNFCWDNAGGGEIINAGPNFSSFQVGRRSGTQVIASVAGVPEPATWAMLIAGFGLVGGAVRSRRVRFAAA